MHARARAHTLLQYTGRAAYAEIKMTSFAQRSTTRPIVRNNTSSSFLFYPTYSARMLFSAAIDYLLNKTMLVSQLHKTATSFVYCKKLIVVCYLLTVVIW